MSCKLLFVDDEASILKAISRRLGFHYDLDIAVSGQEGLDMIETKGPYDIIFTDMRMPKMNGLEFIEQAKLIAPDAVYVMLTGNNDQETAIKALNQGRVFRFLNKPCESEELKQAIEDCKLQHELLRFKKQVVQSDFLSSIRVFTEVVDAIQPDLSGRGERIEKKIDELRRAAGVDMKWEFQFASRLSTIGFSLLAEDDRRSYEQSEPLSSGAQEIRGKAAAITYRLFKDTQKLEVVAAICQQNDCIDGALKHTKPQSAEQTVEVGTLLLSVASLWEDFSRQGLDAEEIAYALKVSLPNLPEEITNHISKSQAASFSPETVEVPLEELEEGMIVGTTVNSSDVSSLIRPGQCLTRAAIERIQASGECPSIAITCCSAGEKHAALAC